MSCERKSKRYNIKFEEFEKMYKHNSDACCIHYQASKKYEEARKLLEETENPDEEVKQKIEKLHEEENELRKREHDNYEQMIRVIIPDYELPEKFGYPFITHDTPYNLEEFHDVFNKVITIQRNIYKFGNMTEEDLTLPQIVDKAMALISLKKYPKFQKPRRGRRGPNMGSMKCQQCIPPPDGGWGFYMSFEGFRFSYPPRNIDIKSEICKDMRQVNNILKEISSR